MISVLLVDDHTILRAGVRSRIEQEPDMAVVGEAADGDEALAKSRSLQVDVILLDLLLPSCNGYEIIPPLLRDSPDSRILVLSSQAAPSSVRRALSAGAAGYLPKQATDAELLRAIRRLAAGDRYVEPGLGARLVADGDTGSHLSELSDRERDVMHLLALGHTNQEIAKRLYISSRTVDTHRAHIMVKLNLQTRADLVMLALADGLVGP